MFVSVYLLLLLCCYILLTLTLLLWRVLPSEPERASYKKSKCLINTGQGKCCNIIRKAENANTKHTLTQTQTVLPETHLLSQKLETVEYSHGPG